MERDVFEHIVDTCVKGMEKLNKMPKEESSILAVGVFMNIIGVCTGAAIMKDEKKEDD